MRNIMDIGFDGEKVVRGYFESKGYKYFQADAIFKDSKGEYCLAEIKKQEKFTKGGDCPFDGHGLPPWQVKARLDFGEAKKMKVYFLVYEESDNCIYYADLKELNKGEKFLTKTKGRVIFPLNSFKIIKLKKK